MQTQWPELICKSYLALKETDILNINTEQDCFDDARQIALYAMDITCNPVNIVITEGGKVTDSLSFEPKANQNCNIKGMNVLLRLYRSANPVPLDEDEINFKDMNLCQRYGHLAQPVETGRKVTVPWCVVNLAKEGKTEILSAEYKERLHIKGEQTDFTIDVLPHSKPFGALRTLSGGRKFCCSNDTDSLTFLVDMDSAVGFLSGECEFFGNRKAVNGVFKENGELTGFDFASSFQDEKLKFPGMLKICKDGIVLCMGGADTDGLDYIPQTEDSLPHCFNNSLYCLKIELKKCFTI